MMSARTEAERKTIDRCAGIRYRLWFLDRARDQGNTLITQHCIKHCQISHMLLVPCQAFLDQRGEDYDDCPDPMHLVS